VEIQKILDQANEHGIVAISAAVEDLKQQKEQSWQESSAACQAYFADVKEREDKVKRRLDDLARQETGIKAKISAMQPGLVNTTVSGATAAFNRIQEELASLEAQRAAVATQMQLLSSAPMPGNLELYKAAETQCDACDETLKQLQSEFDSIREFVREQAKVWDRLNNDLRYITFYTSGACRNDLTKVATHFKNHRPTSDHT